MKKIILATLILFCCFAVNGWATIYTGSITNINSSTFIGNQEWDYDPDPSNGKLGATLSWTVRDDHPNYLGLWWYSYTFSVGSKAISHVILEVSDISPDVISLFNGTTEPYAGPTGFVRDGSNPGMPDAGIYGIKWDTSGNPLIFAFTIVTDRMPMWGDFYAKNGQSNLPGGGFVYGYNSGFGTDTTDPIGDGNAGGWVLVPDTQTGVIPEPGTFLLLGTGLLGIAAIRYRRSKK